MEIKSSHTLVEEALKKIKTLNTKELKDLIKKDKVTLIDIRDIRELWKEGTVKDSIHIPRGMIEFWLDPNSSYSKISKIGEDKNIVLFCALGMRSALATKSLVDKGFKNTSHVNGGFEALKNDGFEIVTKEKK